MRQSKPLILLLSIILLTSISCLRDRGSDMNLGELRVTPNPIDLTQNIFGNPVPLRFMNVGFDTLRVDSVSFNNEALSVNIQNFELAPENSRNVTLRFNYESFDGSGGVSMTVHLREQENESITIFTPFKRILRNISDHPSNNFGADISPDGNRILFYSTRTGSHDIFSADIEGDNTQQHTSDGFNNIPISYLDNNRILMKSDRSGVMQGYILNVASRDLTPITETDLPTYPVKFNSNETQLLYYTENPDGTRDSWLRNFETNQLFRLNSEDRDRDYRKYTPVAFIESETRVLLHAELGLVSKAFVVRTDGEALFNIYDDEWSYIPVAWSESDLRVLGFSNRNLRRNIVTFGASGNDFREITTGPRLEFPVALSNDEQIVIYYSDQDDGINVFYTTFTGSNSERVTANPYEDFPVTIGPDNNTILFNTRRDTYGGQRFYQVYTTVARQL